jgi:hypothetical protein
MHDVLVILLLILLGAVLITLGMGFFSLYRGGQFGRAWSNRLMRVRIGIQFAAILVIAALIYVFRPGH